MEAVRVQDISINDLPWIVEYHPRRCTLCGSCVASCTFGAIHAVMGHVQSADGKIIRRMTIRQVADFANACRGCGMCERGCPNDAIHPVRNPDNRRAILSRDAGPIKRGGRANLNAPRTLDKIIIGRISQMTDPSLDAQRHTFDIRSPLGRVLSLKELPYFLALTIYLFLFRFLFFHTLFEHYLKKVHIFLFFPISIVQHNENHFSNIQTQIKKSTYFYHTFFPNEQIIQAYDLYPL